VDEYIRDGDKVIANDSHLWVNMVHFMDKPIVYRVRRTPGGRFSTAARPVARVKEE
jgi:hypothetical protein